MTDRESPRIRLPGGWSLPPFGQAQWLALLVVAIAMWAVAALWTGVQTVLLWAGSLRPVVHLYLPRDEAARLAPLLAALRRVDGLGEPRRIEARETRAWLARWLGGAPVEGLHRMLPLTVRAAVRSQRPFLIDDLRDVAARFHARLNDEELTLLTARRKLLLARRILIGVALLMMCGMALIVTNTLRLSLLARENEIALMRLLGAEEWFVRLPYLLEGGLIGGGAGLLAALLQWPLLAALRRLGMTPPPYATLVGPILLGGIAVGLAGATIAIRTRTRRPSR
ncbi:MAG: FtsX-like permease family protein [Zetaproteobacteria bacterium]|nr:MAG: FtsX-like permease family protein [Zetaproteobacteria bacterium]